MSTGLLEIDSVRQAFPRPDGGQLLVLDDINLRLEEGQIVALLGRSGSGKSTLLRLIAGITRPTNGTLTYLGAPIQGPAPGISMVFQSFALFPWLTVLENVELGLEALRLPDAEIRKRALAAIDLIALDVLTAENLRTDFLELWSERRLPIKGVILVTHNIEEAVLMSDRILLFSRNPGHITEEIKVDLPQPRNRLDARFRALVERIYVAMTARPAATPRTAPAPERGIDAVLPRVSANLVSGLIEAVAGPPYNGKADLPLIASSLHMEVDDLFPVSETLQMLHFAEIEGGDIRLTDAGRQFADADIDDRKRLFQRQLLAYVPIAAHIRRVLQDRANHVAPKSRFFDELEDHMIAESAEQTLRAVVAWARYAEAFAYDDETETFSLENPS
jgi:NitT/TauT family transport system ATP-binding protein